MKATYKLKNGKILKCFVWDEFLGYGETFYEYVSIYDINNPQKEIKKKVNIESNGLKYFIFDNEKIYFKDYTFMSYEELLNIIRQNPNNLTKSDFYFTLINENKKFNFFMNVTLNGYIKWKLGIKDNVNIMSICKANEDGRYKKSDWSYKISFISNNGNLKEDIHIRNLYLSDLVQSIKNGSIKLFTDEEVTKIYESNLINEKQKNKIFNKFKNVFKKQKEDFVLI